MVAMDDLRKVGIENIGLITEPKTPVNPNGEASKPWRTHTSTSARSASSRARCRTPVRT